jgi:predicted DNA-binding protein with PD1-like motif
VRSDGTSASFTLDLKLGQALPTKTLTFALGGMHNFVANIIIKTVDGDQQFSQKFPNAESDQVVVFTLPSQLAIISLQAAITEQDVPSDVQTHIHVRGVTFAP